MRSTVLAHLLNTSIQTRTQGGFLPFGLLERVSTRTLPRLSALEVQIEVNRGALPLSSLANVAELLAVSFTDDNLELKPSELISYQIRLMGALHWQAASSGRQYITILCWLVTPGSGEKTLAATATVSPKVDAANFEERVYVSVDQVVACISNMAVAPQYRRRGLGLHVLSSAEEATGDWPVPPSLLALSVHCDNHAAIQLYENAGYKLDDSWIDADWVEAAERGKVAHRRRQVMIKPVSWEDVGGRTSDGTQPDCRDE